MNQPPRIPQALRLTGDARWAEFLDSAQANNVLIPKDPVWQRCARRIFALSEFVGTTCCQRPQMLIDLYHSGELTAAPSPDAYGQRLGAKFDGVDNETELMRRLRRFRNREMVAIAWRDLERIVNLEATMAALSGLAEASLQISLDTLHTWLVDRYGSPCDADGRLLRMVVLGMGKLGAGELNFSSDIDLIFVYPAHGQTSGGTRTTGNEEFFTRLARQLVQMIGARTVDGMVFRVDMDLRPYGNSGPIVMSFDALEEYYIRQGREWERYAWIKARAVAGDLEKGSALIADLKPFIYRRYLDYGAFEALREMKAMIVADLRRKGIHKDIKLGGGGIREIEFFGQIFQLIRGGVTPDLQQRSILDVLSCLSNLKLVPPDVSAELTAAYVFLRLAENRLQMINDQQTHRLPGSDQDRLRLAAAMGFVSWSEFLAALDDHRQRVHLHFEQLLEPVKAPSEDNAAAKPLDRNLVDESADPHRQQVQLAQLGFTDPQTVRATLDGLWAHPATRALSAEGRRRLEALLPQLVMAAGEATHPERAFERLIHLITAIEQRTSYLALLLENPVAIDHLVKLANASPMIISLIAKHPLLLDELLDERTLYAPPVRDEMASEMASRLQQVPDEDLELLIETLCIFKQTNTLRVAAADVTQVLPLMKVSDRLTDIAEIILATVIDIAWGHLVAKHGPPVCRLGDEKLQRGFTVIAYGKLGGFELGYGSDLDLVFLHAGQPGATTQGKRPLDNAQFFARLGQRVIHLLTARTRVGFLYEIDMRLRPSGSSGVLVSHIDGFKNYQLEDAWTWEHQALVKTRAITGEPALIADFEAFRQRVLRQRRKLSRLRIDVGQMRAKLREAQATHDPAYFDLKQGRGGIVDIEFLIQFLVLAMAHRFKALTDWTDIVRLIQTLAEAGIFGDRMAYLLKEAYLSYRFSGHRLALQERPARVPATRFRRLRRIVMAIWDKYLNDPSRPSKSTTDPT